MMTRLMPLSPEQEDLYWLLTSSPMINSLGGATGTQLINGRYGAAVTDRNDFSAALADTCNLPARSNFKRLGFYAEALYQAFCAHHIHVEVIGHNIQIKHAHNDVTKGELDFLLERGHELIHLEMAVKFYLYDHDQQLFIGPNAKDRLDKKLRRMATHQLALSSTDEGKAVVQELGYNSASTELLLKGVLFHHWQQPPPCQTVYKDFEVNPMAEWGVWVRSSEWNTFRESLTNNSTLRAIPKMAWMGLAPSDDKSDPSNDENNARPPMTPTIKNPLGMWVLKSALRKDRAEIVSSSYRIMVVADGWPQLTARNK